MTATRRKFFSQIALFITGAAVSSAALAQAKLSQSDPTAKALGYSEDATKVDTKKYPTYKTGSVCANCTLYSGKVGAATGPCGAFGGKLVSAKGWCMAWVKKA